MKKMKPLFLLTLLFFLFNTKNLYSSDYSDYYSLLTESVFATSDENTGTTVFPILKIPAGGKPEAMGTAQTAVPTDSSSLLYNPALSSVLDLTELSFFHNNWISDSSVESIMFTTRFNDFGIGTGFKLVYLPFTAYDSWGIAESKAYLFEGVAILNASYNFFRNFYFDGVSVGVSLKVGYRHIPTSIYSDQSSLAIMGDAGLYTSFDFLKFYESRKSNWSVGVVFRNAGAETLGEALPTELSAGFSYAPIEPVQVAADFNLPINLLGETAESWYISGGFNADITDFFSFQAGFNYMGSNPRLSLGSTIDLENIAFNINYTHDLTTSTSILNRFSIEAKLKLGDEGRYERQKQVDELYIAGLNAYAEGDLQRAITYWEAALKIDPTFTPAKEFLESAKRSLDLLGEMLDLNKVE
ncbi:MAG: UPF0164 family protein [Spirochaetales bacterium]|nr:UPF0164 family protein [Spirochaetales bacterium]